MSCKPADKEEKDVASKPKIRLDFIGWSNLHAYLKMFVRIWKCSCISENLFSSELGSESIGLWMKSSKKIIYNCPLACSFWMEWEEPTIIFPQILSSSQVITKYKLCQRCVRRMQFKKISTINYLLILGGFPPIISSIMFGKEEWRQK